jgi:hypothetical protein
VMCDDSYIDNTRMDQQGRSIFTEPDTGVEVRVRVGETGKPCSSSSNGFTTLGVASSYGPRGILWICPQDPKLPNKIPPLEDVKGWTDVTRFEVSSSVTFLHEFIHLVFPKCKA